MCMSMSNISLKYKFITVTVSYKMAKQFYNANTKFNLNIN